MYGYILIVVLSIGLYLGRRQKERQWKRLLRSDSLLYQAYIEYLQRVNGKNKTVSSIKGTENETEADPEETPEEKEDLNYKSF